jgi:hypothetical protein
MIRRALSLIAVILGFALVASAGAIPVSDERMMISGTIELVEQDIHGVPKTLDLVSPELGRFRVASDLGGRKQLEHIGEWVTVFGTVELAGGVRVVHVDGFRLLPLQTRRSGAPIV